MEHFNNLKKITIIFWLLPLIDSLWDYMNGIISSLLFVWIYDTPITADLFKPSFLFLGIITIVTVIIFKLSQYAFLLLIYKVGKYAMIITIIFATIQLSYFFYLTTHDQFIPLIHRLLGCMLVLLSDVPFFYVAYYLRKKMRKPLEVE